MCWFPILDEGLRGNAVKLGNASWLSSISINPFDSPV